VRVGPILTGPLALSVSFSRTGNLLAFAGVPRTIVLWNVADPARPIRLSAVNGPASTVSSVAISPDGQFLAAAGGTKVGLWRLTDPRHPLALTPLTGPTNAVSSVAFDPSGRILVAGSWDAKAWLWSVAQPAHPAPLGQPLTGPAASINSVAFSSDGAILAAGGMNGITELWNLDIDATITRICTTTSNALTASQWSQDLPDVPYTPPCAHPGHYGLLRS